MTTLTDIQPLSAPIVTYDRAIEVELGQLQAAIAAIADLRTYHCSRATPNC